MRSRDDDAHHPDGAMKPAEIDLVDDREIYQGDDYHLDLYFFLDDGVTPRDLTSYTSPKSQVRASKASTSVTDFTAAFDADRTTGHVTLDLTGTQTALMLESTTNVWDYEMIDPASKKSTWYAGAATIVAQVTHA